jgi:hypothetical protein
MFAIVLCFSASAFAQEITGGIEGTVRDPNGAVVPGVQITVKGVARSAGARSDATAGFTRTITADNSGFYRMQGVPPGNYTVSTDATAGFGEASKTNVEVVLGKNTVVDMNLTVAGTTNVVDVVADGVIAIDPTSNKVQTNITAQTIEMLPKGVNFTSVLASASGVRDEPLSGGFQIDGASGSENTFIIDGQEVSNFRRGTLDINNNVPFQIVQEIQVKSGGFEAEFGGATGGVVNVATKQGGNEIHGEVGTSFSIAKFQADPRPFHRAVTIAATANLPALRTTEQFQPPKDGGTNHFPFFALSGPIIKNRAWFFIAYAPQFINADRTYNYQSADPRIRTITSTQLYTQRRKQEYAYSRVDLQPFQSLRLTGSYLWNPLEIIGQPDGFGNFTANPPQITFPTGEIRRGADFLNRTGGRQTSNNTNGSLIWTPTGRFVLTARAGYSFLNEKVGNYGVPAVAGLTRWVAQDRGVAIPAGFGIPGFGQNFPGFSQLEFDRTIRRTFDADASYLLSGFGGRHHFKGGFQFNGIHNKVQSTLVDTIVIRIGNTIAQASGRNIPVSSTAIGTGWLQRFGVLGAAGSDNRAFYIQDSWQPINRLTLNLGVRIEKEQSPSFAPGRPGIEFGWGDKIAPRLGFAYDILGDGKNKLFGSYGKFYDRFKYELPRGSFGGNFFRNDYFEIFPGQTISSFNRQTVIGTNPDPIGGNCPLPSSTGLSRCQLDFRIPSNAEVGGLDFGGVDPNIEAFQQSEFTIGFERDMGRGYFLATRYTHKQVDVAVEDIGFISPLTGGEAYIIGNPGRGLAREAYLAKGFIPLEAVRDYDAVEVRVNKRFATSSYINASYTWSRLFGNYAGLASSDEAGRTSPNVNRNFDLPFIGFSALGKPDDGRLATDRPHSFNISGAYTFGWMGSRTNSTEISGLQLIQSGTPLTTRFIFDGVAGQILNGRGDLGRTEMFTQTNMAISHKYRFGRDSRFTMAFDVDILNLFNEDNVLAINDQISSRSILPADLGFPNTDQGLVDYFKEYQTKNTADRIRPLLGQGTFPNVLFGLPSTYQGPRSVRFGFRLLF